MRTNAKPTNKRCICPTCNEVFSTLSNFDRHRVGDWDSKQCVYPEFVGLEIKQGAGGTWWGMLGATTNEESDNDAK